MLPTPSTTHIDPALIYSPAEDSYLLLDTLSSPTETSFLTQRFNSQLSSQGAAPHPSPSPLVLDVGTGSGVVLAFVAANARAIFGRGDVLVLGGDVNEWACRAAGRTVVQACCEEAEVEVGNEAATHGNFMWCGNLLGIMCADLTTSLRPGSVDVLIFNPPYVPSEIVPKIGSLDQAAEAMVGSFERDSYLLSLSYEGGVDGMEVTNRLLEQLPTVLSHERGLAYVLLCQQNRPDEVMQRIRDWGKGWTVKVVGRSGKQAGWEKLVILRICRS